MIKNIFFKTILKKGSKGEKGDAGISYEVPTGAVMAYDGLDTPEGYEPTLAPAGLDMVSDLTMAEYEALSYAQKYNGNYYHIPEAASYMDRDFIGADITQVIFQNGMSYNTNSGTLNISYVGGSMIGATLYYALDFTNISKVDFKLKCTTEPAYKQTKWGFVIGISNTIPPTAGYASADDIPFLPNTIVRYNYQQYYIDNTSHSIDTSELQGTKYLIVYAPSWTISIKDFIRTELEANSEQIKVMDKTFGLQGV